MKRYRNDKCSCGSEKKIKNCCGKKQNGLASNFSFLKGVIYIGLLVFISFSIWGVVEFYATDRPEMEAYRCDNPNCNRIHYRPISEVN
tara:strand:- start:376 stop:639 length:264 start_codon:yes stop_codon:yes gene_type:complete